MNRRDFLKMSMAAAVVATAPSLLKGSKKTAKPWKVVVGAPVNLDFDSTSGAISELQSVLMRGGVKELSIIDEPPFTEPMVSIKIEPTNHDSMYKFMKDWV